MKKTSAISLFIDMISAIFLPIVNLLSAAGILKGLLAIALAVGALSEADRTYQVLFAIGDALFYFLPLLLAYTAAAKFHANPFTAVVIAAVLLHPGLTQLFEAGNASVFHIPIVTVNYPYSVIPILLAVGTQAALEKLLTKILPELVKGFLTPLLSIFTISFATLLLLGPIGKLVGDMLATGYESIYAASPIAAGIALGASIQVMVIFGFQWGLIPIAMNNVAVNGFDTILTFFAPSVFAQAGAALAVFCKTKDKAFRTVVLSAAVSACFGITEPAMFGVNLPLKKPMIAVCIAGGIGGGMAGFSGAAATSFAFPGIATLPIFFGKGFILFAAACFISMAIAFLLTLFLKFDAVPGAKKPLAGQQA